MTRAPLPRTSPRRRCSRVLLLTLVAAGGACAPPPSNANDAAAAAPPMAEVHARKCGACHSLPEAKTRTRAYLEHALSRHHKRVHLSDDEWRAMIDYLASPG